jgi:hypothetical protein
VHSQFAALRYLIRDALCPWNSERVRISVLDSASGQQLQWLRQADAAPWTPAVLCDMLFKAGTHNNLAAARWLRAQGAAWPDSFLYNDRYGRKACWPLMMMQWARASGCPWGLWSEASCKLLSGHSNGSVSDPWLQDTIMWAHAAGCSCDSKLHHIAARFRAAGSIGGSSGSSGGSKGSNSEGARWNAKLFNLFYTAAGHAQLKRGLRFVCTAALAVLPVCVLIALAITSSAQQGVRSVESAALHWR